MEITVPRLSAVKGWRKTLERLSDEPGGSAVKGDFLQPADVVDVPVGRLIVVVDKNTLGYRFDYEAGVKAPVQDAAVTIYVVTPTGLERLWNRHYKNASSAFRATTRKKIEVLLQQYPAPSGAARVVIEARRPNRRAGECRWCYTTLGAGEGHVVGHGDYVEVEHFQRRCPDQGARDGESVEPASQEGATTVVPVCQNCNLPYSGVHERYDSSDLMGLVCDECNLYEDFELAFA